MANCDIKNPRNPCFLDLRIVRILIRVDFEFVK